MFSDAHHSLAPFGWFGDGLDHAHFDVVVDVLLYPFLPMKGYCSGRGDMSRDGIVLEVYFERRAVHFRQNLMRAFVESRGRVSIQEPLFHVGNAVRGCGKR